MAILVFLVTIMGGATMAPQAVAHAGHWCGTSFGFEWPGDWGYLTPGESDYRHYEGPGTVTVVLDVWNGDLSLWKESSVCNYSEKGDCNPAFCKIEASTGDHLEILYENGLDLGLPVAYTLRVE